MDNATVMDRLQFAFTITYHYLFPQITMSLALLLVVFKAIYLRTGNEHYNLAARFWARLFAITFVMGVVTGVPMEFQFGTNWAKFSQATGSLIAQMLAMEGAFAFFLESAFVGLFLFGEQLLGQRMHLISAVLIWAGSWLSGFFIIAANAWMQHPVGYRTLANGTYELTSFKDVLFNSWIIPEYLHTMSGATITGAFIVAGLGAYYLLAKQHEEYGKIFVRIGVIVGLLASMIQLYPSGDLEGQQVTVHQPVKLAAMEGLFHTENGAGIAILGQPDIAHQTLDNPIVVPNVLSFLTYRQWKATVKGLDAFPRTLWPDNITLTYFVYHIMVGLGTVFMGVTGFAVLLLWRRTLFHTRWMLWILLLAMPFPLLANTAGWMTAEVGRAPWLAYGLMRISSGPSPLLSAGNVLFTLIGFAGMYLLLGLLYVVLVVQEAMHGPRKDDQQDPAGDGIPSLSY